MTLRFVGSSKKKMLKQTIQEMTRMPQPPWPKAKKAKTKIDRTTITNEEIKTRVSVQSISTALLRPLYLHAMPFAFVSSCHADPKFLMSFHLILMPQVLIETQGLSLHS